MKRFLASLIAVAALSLACFSQNPSAAFTIYQPGSDYCQNPSVPKTQAVINISTATTTELVAAVAGKTVYVCKVNGSIAGTSPTLIFKTGTKVSTACDTGAVSLTGTYALTTGTVFDLSSNTGVVLKGAAAGEICITSGGTTPSYQGVITYVQR